MISRSRKKQTIKVGDLLTVSTDTFAHFYSAAGGCDSWDFVIVGDSFMIVEVLAKSVRRDGDWNSALAVSNDGIVVVLSYPTLHCFQII